MPPPSPARVAARYLASTQPLIQRLMAIRPSIAHAAQKVYDQWEQDEDGMDEEFGGGGICDSVASSISEVVTNHLHDVDIVDGGQDGDDHAFIVVLTPTEAVEVDIPPGVYETGGGYNWRKREGVTFSPSHVSLAKLDRQDF